MVIGCERKRPVVEPAEFCQRQPDGCPDLGCVRLCFPFDARGQVGSHGRFCQLGGRSDVKLLNMGLLSHPLNWVTLAIWVGILGFLIHSFNTQMLSLYPTNSSTQRGDSV